MGVRVVERRDDDHPGVAGNDLVYDGVRLRADRFEAIACDEHVGPLAVQNHVADE